MDTYKIIDSFKAEIEILKNDEHEPLLKRFTTGEYAFDDYIKNCSNDDCLSGNGVTYLVFDVSKNIKEVVAYFTLSVTSIPFIDQLKDINHETGKPEFDRKLMGIPSAEIKMFAVNTAYQDTFLGEDLIASLILKTVISFVNDMSSTVIGIKALFLNSVPEAENFYLKNYFCYLKENMRPLHSINSEFKPMYCAIREIPMTYEE